MSQLSLIADEKNTLMTSQALLIADALLLTKNYAYDVTTIIDR